MSRFVDDDPVVPDVAIDWPKWDEKRALSSNFIGYLNLLLQFTQPTHPSETQLMATFSKVGIGPGRPFTADRLDEAVRSAIEAGVRVGEARLKDAIAHAFTSVGMFGSRKTLGRQYLKRAVAAAAGIYGNNAEEAIYVGWHIDADDQPLSGDHRYEVTFQPGKLPPVKLFCSITMYELPSRLLVNNLIDRYSIGDRTPGLNTAEDGSLTLVFQPEKPAEPDRVANWLPTPRGNWTAIFRLYGPEQPIIDGSWTEPPMRRIG